MCPELPSQRCSVSSVCSGGFGAVSAELCARGPAGHPAAARWAGPEWCPRGSQALGRSVSCCGSVGARVRAHAHSPQCWACPCGACPAPSSLSPLSPQQQRAGNPGQGRWDPLPLSPVCGPVLRILVLSVNCLCPACSQGWEGDGVKVFCSGQGQGRHWLPDQHPERVRR